MTEIKSCGTTSLEDAHLAADLGAWAVGMIFWPGSPGPATQRWASRSAPS